MSLELLIELMLGVVVATSTFALMRVFAASSDVQRRLWLGRSAAGARSGLFRNDKPTHPVLLWVQSAAGLGDSPEGVKLRRELALAGIEHPAAQPLFVILRFGLTIGLPFALIGWQSIAGNPLPKLMFIFASVVLAVAGFMGPSFIVTNRAASRRMQIEQEFPDVLDLMVVCVEAGLGLDTAFIRISEETRVSHARASQEFSRLATELRAGRARADALRAFAERTGAEAIRAFVALLIQTDLLGTSVGQTLRAYSNEMRQGRYLAAEKKAMRVPVLMTLPLIGFILPVIATALLLPPLIDVARILIPTLTRHHGG
jgi:tight adherence protein C